MEVSKPFKVDIENWKPKEYYVEILENTSLENFCRFPPVRPQPGNIYLFHSTKKEDWKSDQHRWKLSGIKHLPPRRPVVTCLYYQCYEGSGFFRRAYFQYNQGSLCAEKTVVHYVGSLTNVIHRPHGNRKYNKERLHVMTAKSQIQQQKSQIKNAPQKVYKQMVTEDVHPALCDVFLPRDSTQVRHTIYNERERKLISRDDIYGLFLLGEELSGFVAKLELLPNFYSILYSDKSLEMFNKIGNINHDHPVILHYDTTFNLGNFYVSALTYRHSLFINEPVVPLFILIHDTKKKEVHSQFFKFVTSVCASINGKVIVSDREQAIVLAIKECLPASPYFFCWNHIQQDVKSWVYNHQKAQLGDRLVYSQHIWDLLDSDNIEQYTKKIVQMSEHWTSTFRAYFERHLKEDIKSSAKWNLIKYNLYTPRSGITINAAESFNAVLKRCVENKEVKCQVLGLVLYQLDLYYIKEILRGMCGKGNYNLKDRYKFMLINSSNVEYPTSNLPLDKLPYIFSNRDFKVEANSEDIERPFTKFALGKYLVLQNKVKLITDEQVFLVSDTKRKSIVRLFPRESCTCSLSKDCHHIIAAKISIGIEQQKQTGIKLTKILNKKRGFRSGRKKPHHVTVVEAAADATVGNTENRNQTILLPTLDPKSDLIKNRFIAPFSQNSGTDTIITSTPIQISQTAVHRKKHQIISSSDSEEDLNFTFNRNFKNNKSFKILGRLIFPNDLKCLENTAAKSNKEKYFFDIIFDVYYAIIIKEIFLDQKKSITVFPVEGFIINFIKHENLSSFTQCLQYFLKHKIPEFDIVLFPITMNNHCSTLLVFRKQKMIVHLDSLIGIHNSKEITYFVLKMYKSYAIDNNTAFHENDWTVFVPSDTPQQNNGYDCGAYCCLFVEILLTGNVDLMTHHFNASLDKYRVTIKNLILENMKKIDNSTQLAQTYFYSKKTLLNATEPSVTLPNLINSYPTGYTSTIDFLANIVKNYWDENSILNCFLGEHCTNIANGEMILCKNCDHWYHLKCLNLPNKPSVFICTLCSS